jgi:hypothetical protein
VCEDGQIYTQIFKIYVFLPIFPPLELCYPGWLHHSPPHPSYATVMLWLELQGWDRVEQEGHKVCVGQSLHLNVLLPVYLSCCHISHFGWAHALLQELWLVHQCLTTLSLGPASSHRSLLSACRMDRRRRYNCSCVKQQYKSATCESCCTNGVVCLDVAVPWSQKHE